MNSKMYLSCVLVILVLSQFCFAQSYDLYNNCFIANSQISVSGQLDYNVLANSSQNFISNENTLFLQNNGEMLAISESNDTITLQFFSQDEANAKSQIEYINSIGLIKPQINISDQIVYLKNQECKQIFSDEIYPYAMNTIQSPSSTAYDSRNFVKDSAGAGSTGAEVYGKEIAQSFDSVQSAMQREDDSNKLKTTDLHVSAIAQSQDVQTANFGLDSILISIFFGSALTLFLVIVAVHFRGQFFRPIEYSQDLVLGKTQLEILEALSESQKIPTDIALQIKKSKSTTIEHLDALQKMGLVEKISHPGKKFVYYRLSQPANQILIKKRSSGVAI